MAAADHVMLKDKDGKDVMVKVTKGTKSLFPFAWVDRDVSRASVVRISVAQIGGVSR